MPKRQTGSRSLRKREQLLDYARPQTFTISTEETKLTLKEVVPPSAELLDMSVPAPILPIALTFDYAPVAPIVQEVQSLEPPATEVQDLQKLLQFGELTPVKESQRFQQYDLLWEIHKDALSTTYVAKYDAIDGFVAVRVFNERVSDSAQIRAIQKAAIKANELTHPNHVSVYENGVSENGTPYVVMDWLEGETLTSLFKRSKRLDIASFLNIFTQVCEVLTEAHSHNLYHGNLSPDRISIVTSEIESDTIKVCDFGMPIDTIQNAFYMSPEQCLDQNRVDARSDIYSLGCIMYESLVGRPPSLGTADLSVDFLHELANQYSKDSPEHNALKLLDCIIKRCLNRTPSKRFSSTRELMSALALVSNIFENPVSSKNKRLPRNAEKLLLFRFLDKFDRKITAALSAYLLLGLFATKYIGEMQLQKFIDEAQVARFVDWPQAQSNYKDAIKLAGAIGKPPGLLADLHWELADSYRVQSVDSTGAVKRDELAKDAIAEYEKAFSYFNHGPHLRSYALGLLDNMSQLYMRMPSSEVRITQRDANISQLRKLMKDKNYTACAKLAEKLVAQSDDSSYRSYAAQANLQIGMSLPAAKGKSYLARSVWYYRGHGDAFYNPALKPLNAALTKLHLMWPIGDTYVRLGYEELLKGDLAAAAGYLNNAVTEEGTVMSIPIFDSLRLRQESGCIIGDENKIKALPLLERQLVILEQAHGKNGPKLEMLMLDLASCYRAAGRDSDAIKAYERYFSIAPKESFVDATSCVAYCDLLSKNNRGKDVPKFLLGKLHSNSGLDTSSPLYMLLIEAYSKANMKAEAIDTLQAAFKIPEYPKWDAQVIKDEENALPNTDRGTFVPFDSMPRHGEAAPRKSDPFGEYQATSAPDATPKVAKQVESEPAKTDWWKNAGPDSGF